MLDVIDALLAMYAPEGSEVTRDNTVSDPMKFMPGTVYAWVNTRVQRPVGTGEVQEDFEIMVVHVAPDEGEAAGGIRTRKVSEVLEGQANAFLTAIRNHASNNVWGHIEGRVDWDAIKALDVRGVAVIVAGNRLVTGA